MQDLRRFKNIVAFRNPIEKDSYLALHTTNLEIAEIDSSAWQNFERISWGDLLPVDREKEFFSNDSSPELKNWSDSVSDETKTIGTKSDKFYTLQMNISQVCNLKCDYCGAGGDGTYGSEKYKVDLSKAYQQVSYMAEKFVENDPFHIHFIGGEPLLYPKAIEQVVKYARLAVAGKNLKLSFGVTTNGTMIDESVAQLLADMNAKVVVSIDGPDEVNDVTRPAKRKDMSSTDLTRNGLQELLKVRDRISKLTFNCVFGKHNTRVLDAYRFLMQWQPDTIHLGFAAQKGDSTATQSYLTEFKKVLEEAHRLDGRTGLLKIEPFSNILKSLEQQTKKLNYCGAGKSLIQMDTKGGLYACNWFMNDPTEAVGVAGSPEKEKLSQYSQSFIDLHDCQKCWAKYLCGGGCMFFNSEKNNAKHVSDPEFCERTRTLAMLAIQYFHKIHNV